MNTDSESREERQETRDEYPQYVGMLYANVQDSIKHTHPLYVPQCYKG